MTTPTPRPAWTGWRKSSKSTDGGECVEARITHDTDGTVLVAVRHSKNPDGPQLRFPASAWTDLTDAIKTGRLYGQD